MMDAARDVIGGLLVAGTIGLSTSTYEHATKIAAVEANVARDDAMQLQLAADMRQLTMEVNALVPVILKVEAHLDKKLALLEQRVDNTQGMNNANNRSTE